nr:MAG TPA: hypothetical protein [Caudoviricetes sp.]DAH36473.1 MAG TPA: hypothetical protein [Caudoviricetes sp.]DAU47636.1 MAG TPA: hypothetical protein [Caudoviricetes sp.]
MGLFHITAFKVFTVSFCRPLNLLTVVMVKTLNVAI